VEARKNDNAPSQLTRLESISWLLIAAVATWALVTIRGSIGSAQVALIYVLIVLGASARRGRRLGLSLAAGCFFAFNFFFVPPYATLTVANPSDWIVLLAFLTTSAVAAQLLHRSQNEADLARQRTLELRRLATAGAEGLQAAHADDAIVAIARVIREELGTDECEVYLRDGDKDLVRLVARATAAGTGSERHISHVERRVADIVLTADASTIIVPLQVRARPVGLLRLHSGRALSSGVIQHPFAEVLAYYAALGLERLRLTADAEHADALREADRLKDALLAAVSHDLRTPLTTIKAAAHEMAVDGDQRARTIEVETDRLNRYVSNLLDLSRLNGGALKPSFEIVPAADLLGAAVQQAAAILADRDVRLSVAPGKQILARCDFVLTLHALVNVLENAVRYSGSEYPVEVHAYLDGEWMRLDIADRGTGIREADRERIFQPFERGDHSVRVGGAGLGLPIARRLLEVQSGTLTFADRAGGGTVFTLSVPSTEPADLGDGSL
jgi:two-component system, OmpR family, sensor histidine kinase KdpD